MTRDHATDIPHIGLVGPELVQSLLIGSMFGDGALSLAPKKQSASLEITHSASELPYLMWKYSVFQELCVHGPKLRTDDGGFGTNLRYRLRTRSLPELLAMRTRFYPAGRKIITAQLLNLLTPAALAVWYQDDGSFDATQGSIRFCTHRYTLSEVELAAEWFAGQGLHATLNRCSGRQAGQFVLRLGRAAATPFLALTAPFIHPSMARKVPAGMTLGEAL
ncbi:hypothetical protein [Deinococcus ruber]|nr:hypothetical protein [Deinococcus ruber]